MTKEIRIYNDPVKSIEIASKPHEIALVLKDEVKNHPIAKAICTDIPIRSYEFADYQNSIKALVIRLALDFGSNMKDEDLIALTGRLIDFISRKYHFLTIKEIDLAFENGTSGEYGDNFALNFKTVASFLSKYVKHRRDYVGSKYTQADISRINNNWKSNNSKVNEVVDGLIKSKVKRV